VSHFHSSVRLESADVMMFRSLAIVSPRQSPGDLMCVSKRFEASLSIVLQGLSHTQLANGFEHDLSDPRVSLFRGGGDWLEVAEDRPGRGRSFGGGAGQHHWPGG